MTNKMELKFSASLSNEILARQAVIAFISPLDPSLEEINEIKTIIAEGVSNAIIHGYELDASKDVFLKAIIDKDELELTIVDYGKGIANLEEARMPHYTTRPDLERAGMGLTIMETLADSFAIKTLPGMGCKLVIKKKLAKEGVSYGTAY